MSDYKPIRNIEARNLENNTDELIDNDPPPPYQIVDPNPPNHNRHTAPGPRPVECPEQLPGAMIEDMGLGAFANLAPENSFPEIYDHLLPPSPEMGILNPLMSQTNDRDIPGVHRWPIVSVNVTENEEIHSSASAAGINLESLVARLRRIIVENRMDQLNFIAENNSQERGAAADELLNGIEQDENDGAIVHLDTGRRSASPNRMAMPSNSERNTLHIFLNVNNGPEIMPNTNESNDGSVPVIVLEDAPEVIVEADDDDFEVEMIIFEDDD